MPKPTTYSRRVADKIIDAVAGGKSLVSACSVVGVPRTTALRWRTDNRDSFGDRLDRAYEAKCEMWIDELDDLAAQELGSDSMAAVQARRTQIDVRKWIASRLIPHRWGERLEHRLTAMAVHVYVPDNARLAPGDNARLIEGEAVEQPESDA